MGHSGPLFVVPEPGTNPTIKRAPWTRVLRGTPMPRRSYRDVALALAAYADASGEHVHPKVERIAEETGYSLRTVKYATLWLREHRWITCTDRPRHRAKLLGSQPAEYRLTFPDRLPGET